MANGIRTRETVAGMANDHPTLAAYRAAVREMRNLPESDPRNWRRQALIHSDGCPHGNWYFLPWHRKYVLDFERICRDLSGDPSFALPYWDWTSKRSIPAPFWEGTLRDQTRVIGQNDQISGDFVGRPVIDRVLRMNDFELFASTRPRQPFEQNNTDPVWQRRGAPRRYWSGHRTIRSTSGSTETWERSCRRSIRSSGCTTATSTGCGRNGTRAATEIPSARFVGSSG